MRNTPEKARAKQTMNTRALARTTAKDLPIIVQSVGVGNVEVNELVENGQVRKVIANYPFYRSATKGQQHAFERLVRAGKMEVEACPMGTFVEKLRAGGAGIPAFYTPTGVGTYVAEGKEVRVFNGREYLLEVALRPDYAFVHAFMGDRMGNLMFHKTARNYNPEMGKSARITIAEVENLVEPGEIDPDMVHLPGVYVKRVVKVERPAIDITIERVPAED